jgi:hypothetical protein
MKDKKIGIGRLIALDMSQVRIIVAYEYNLME